MSASRPPDTRRPAVVFGVSACMLAVVTLVWHGAALGFYAATLASQRTVDARLGAARTAEMLEPWNAHFEWRRVTLEAERLLDQGEIDAAFWLVQPYSRVVRGDALYREVYQRAVRLKAPLDARKAHVQHGKEKADGSLDPEDVQK